MESRFCVSMDAMRRREKGTIDITGTSGRKLLEGSIRERAGILELQLCSVGCSEEPRAMMEMDLSDRSSMKIYGRGKIFFGTLEVAGSANECVLIEGGEARMLLAA